MPSKKTTTPPSSKIISLIPDFDRDLKAGPRWSQKPAATSTRNKYLKGVRYFCRWLSPTGKEENCVTTVRDVTREIITAYFGELYEKYAVNTVMVHHICLSAFFHFCVDYEELEPGESPMRWVKCPKAEVKPAVVLSTEDIKAMLGTCSGRSFIDKRDYAILRVFLSTGMRLSELTNLQLADVNLNEGILEIRRGKGGKPRTVAYGPQVARALGQYIHWRERHKHTRLPDLWIGLRGKLRGNNSIREVIYRHARQAGIDHVHPHLFRHWFANEFLSNEGQEHDLQQLAGWSNSRMLERYGASRQRERALANAKRIGVGEQF